MTIPTQLSLHGFIATDPDLHVSENGVARFSLRVGMPRFRRAPNGSTTQLEPTLHDLVTCRKTAERAYETFRKGDTFVSTGHVNDNPYERHGHRIVREEFVARHVGHDLVLTKYVVERTQSALDSDLAIACPTEPVPEPVVGL